MVNFELESLPDDRLEALASVDQSEVRRELRRRERERRQQEQEREEQREQRNVEVAHQKAARELSEDELQAVVERPEKSSRDGHGRLNVHKLTEHVPDDGPPADHGEAQKAAERELERRRAARQAEAQQRSRQPRSEWDSTVTVGRWEVPSVAVGLVLVLVGIVGLGRGGDGGR